MMTTHESYNALLVEPESSTREKFRQVAIGSRVLEELRCYSDSGVALAALEEGLSVNLIFISSSLPEIELREFMKTTRRLPATKSAAQIIVGHGAGRESWRVASNLINGADGFLFAPFSVQAFISATEAAHAARREHATSRERTAIRLLARAIIEQLTEAARLKAGGHPAKLTIKLFAEMCGVLRELTPEQQEIYFNAMIELTEYAAPSFTQKIPSKASVPKKNAPREAAA